MAAGVAFQAGPEEKVDIVEVKQGDGPAAASGDTVVMKYKGTLADGSKFDSGSGFTFTIDAGARAAAP